MKKKNPKQNKEKEHELAFELAAVQRAFLCDLAPMQIEGEWCYKNESSWYVH